MFLGIHQTKSGAWLLPKRCPFFWGKRGSGPSAYPSGKVFIWLVLQQRVFKCQFLYFW